jgi:hypothetical protein
VPDRLSSTPTKVRATSNPVHSTKKSRGSPTHKGNEARTRNRSHASGRPWLVTTRVGHGTAKPNLRAAI